MKFKEFVRNIGKEKKEELPFGLKEKLLSVGLILTDGQVFLVVNPTAHRVYDIPKGEVEKGEGLKEALIREIKEECNINISKWSSQLIDFGKQVYMSHKDVHVFILILKSDELPPAGNMRCTSMFMLNGRPTPEVIRHKYIRFEQTSVLNPHMERIVKKAWRFIRNEIKQFS